MFAFFLTFRRCERGATAIEYSLIAALVSVAAIGALSAVGDSLLDVFGTVATAVDAASQASGTT